MWMSQSWLPSEPLASLQTLHKGFVLILHQTPLCLAVVLHPLQMAGTPALCLLN